MQQEVLPSTHGSELMSWLPPSGCEAIGQTATTTGEHALFAEGQPFRQVLAEADPLRMKQAGREATRSTSRANPWRMPSRGLVTSTARTAGSTSS